MIARIDHVSIAVKDQKKAERFYRDILGALRGPAQRIRSPNIFGKYFPWVIYPVWKLFRLRARAAFWTAFWNPGKREFIISLFKRRISAKPWTISKLMVFPFWLQ